MQIVLEQQVSLRSAAALHARLEQTLGGVTPETVLAAGADGLRAVGLTRQKAGYVAGLADRVARGALPLDSLGTRPDDEVVALLTGAPGVGPWTAGVYLLMALLRPDVWPPGDLALHQALAELHGLVRRPTSDEAVAMAGRWRPWRAVAARVLWQGYLGARGA